MASDNNIGGKNLLNWSQTGLGAFGLSKAIADAASTNFRSVQDQINSSGLPKETLEWLSKTTPAGVLASAAYDAGKSIDGYIDRASTMLTGTYKDILNLVSDEEDLPTSPTPDATGQKSLFLPFDDWGTFGLGPMTFTLPPLSVNVTEINSSSAAATIARGKTSSKVNPGNKAVRVDATFLFRTYDDLVGTDDAWGQIDSLRGLVTIFRGSPFMPVKNRYLNEVWGIDMLALETLQVSTVPGIPYAISATISAYQFNWRALVPIDGTAHDLLNEERFLYHYAQCKKVLDDYVNVPFTPDRLWGSTSDPLSKVIGEDAAKALSAEYSGKSKEWDLADKQWDNDNARLEFLFGPLRYDHLAAGQVELYYSDRDMASELWLNNMKKNKVIDPSKLDGGVGAAIANAIGVAGLSKLLDGVYGEAVTPEDMALQIQQEFAKQLSENDEQQKTFEAFQFLVSISQYSFADEEATIKRVDEMTRKIVADNPKISPARARQLAWTAIALTDSERIAKSKKVLNALVDKTVGWIHEWEIPMRRLGMMNEDLSAAIIVDSISVGTQNALVPLPIAGKTSGVHQHMGNTGTNAVITFKVIGEVALQYLKNRFDRINYSAMRNKEVGVSGFLGVENHLINLMGVKYAMLDSMQVSTIEGQPHAYQVVMQMSDFDILQQKREMPTPVERLGIIDRMSKGHPIMRARQELSRTCAYPDMPLPRRRIKKTTIVPKASENTEEMAFDVEEVTDWGPYYDPDYYFNSSYFFYEDDEGSKVDYSKDKKGRSKSVSQRIKDLSYFVPDFQKFIKAKLGTEGDISLSAEQNTETVPEPKNQTKEQAAQSEFDKLTVDRVYMPGDNEMQTLEYLDKMGTDKGKDVKESDFVAALSRSLIYGNDERKNVDQMFKEKNYASVEGRMVQAFPTCVVYIIDEGEFFLSYKMYDTFYGIQGLMSVDVTVDKEAPMDTAVLQFSNLYGKLSTAAWWQDFSLPKFITDMVEMSKNTKQRVMGYTEDIENLKLEPGMRVQVRFGYSADPTKLPIVFNGSIAEVSDGNVLTVVAQGDGVEIDKISESNFGANAMEGHAKWQSLWMNSPFVEPQQLLIKMLAGQGTAWSEFVKRAEAGIASSSGQVAAPHFGAIVWDHTKMGGDRVFRNNIRDTVHNVTQNAKKDANDIDAGAPGTGGDSTSAPPGTRTLAGITGLARTAWNVLEIGAQSADDVAMLYWKNTYNNLQDFELYKRNIYPGNGTGMRSWETDPTPHREPWGWFGYLVGSLSDSDYAFSQEDTDSGDTEERAFSLNTSGKTNWQIGKMAEALMPNYILAVRPFEHRSTLFYGKQNWLYTSGVIPFFDGQNVDNDMKIGDWQDEAMSLNEVYQLNQKGIVETEMLEIDSVFDVLLPWRRLGLSLGAGSIRKQAETKTDNAIVLRDGANTWGWAWFKKPKTVKKAQSLLDAEEKNLEYGEFATLWASFMAWCGESGLVNDVVMGEVISNTLFSCPDSPLGERGWWMLHNQGDGKTEGNTAGGPRAEDDWNDFDDNKKAWDCIVELFDTWKRLDYGKTPFDDKAKKVLDKWIKHLTGIATLSNLIAVDPAKAKKALDSVGQAAAEEGPAKEAEKPKTENPKSQDVTEALDAVRHAVAVMISEKAGGIESMMDMAAQNDMLTQLEWRCLEDNSYYGVLAGTKYDPYAGAEYYYDPSKNTQKDNSGAEGSWLGASTFWSGNTRSNGRKDTSGDGKDPLNVKQGAQNIANDELVMDLATALIPKQFLPAGIGSFVKTTEGWKKKPPEDIIRLRTAQIMVDNPFTKEFGEPVVEIREPFSRFHTITSETNLVANTVFVDETNVYNQVTAIAHSTKKNDGKKKQTIKVDKSIPPHLTKEMVVDTGLNYSMWNAFDTVNHKNMGRWHVKKFLQQMYAGELICLGNPYYRPYDFVWMWDSIQRMNGMAEIGRVTHHYGVDMGYVTAVKLEPIVMLEDAHMFHVMNMWNWNQREEHSLRMMSQNVSAGAVDRYQAESEAERLGMQNIVTDTMAIIDGNPNSGVQIGVASVVSPFMRNANEIPKEDKKKDLGMNSGYQALREFKKTGSTDKVPDSLTTVPDGSVSQVADAKKDGKGLAGSVVGGGIAAIVAAVAGVATAGIATAGAVPVLGFLFAGGIKQAIGAAFEEPFQVITLHKDGRPFQAGLRGSRGVIVGEPGSVPLLTDWFGYETLPRDMSSVFSKFGYKLDTSLKIRNAISESELIAMEELERLSGRAEADIDDVIGDTAGVFESTVIDIVDGDTYYFSLADLPADLKDVIKPSHDRADCYTNRLRYIDCPETPKDGSFYENYSEDRPEYGGSEVKDWVAHVRLPAGTKVKLRYNKMRPADDYGRLLTVLVDSKSCSKYADNAYLISDGFSWMKESLNGEMLTSNAEINIWTNDTKTTYQPRLLRELVQPLFTVPSEDDAFIRR